MYYTRHAPCVSVSAKEGRKKIYQPPTCLVAIGHRLDLFLLHWPRELEAFFARDEMQSYKQDFSVSVSYLLACSMYLLGGLELVKVGQAAACAL